jgi:hypothetical protein
MFDFVMKMFSEGDAAIPALGMEEFQKTSEEVARDAFNTKVADIQETQLLATGENPIGYYYCSNRGNSINF